MRLLYPRVVLPVIVFSIAVRAHAQGGCVDSPEAPTSMLMLVGSFGMIYGSSVAMKLLGKLQKAAVNRKTLLALKTVRP